MSLKDEIIIMIYSYCWLEEDEKQLVHIKATTLLEEYKDGYKIVLGGDE